jgi:multisite-specific tRNA:(cytosine-C5)-methyltransferase
MTSVYSALSLRLFGADITTAGRDVAQRKKPVGPTPESGTPILGEEDDGEMAIEVPQAAEMVGDVS